MPAAGTLAGTGPTTMDTKRLLILTEGLTEPIAAKTAVSLLRYRLDDVAALLDSTRAGETAGELLGVGGGVPVVASVAEAMGRDAGVGQLVVGVAPAGGVLPGAMRAAVRDAAEAGLDVVSGLHQFLADDEEFGAAAKRGGGRLIDLRRNAERTVADRRGLLEPGRGTSGESEFLRGSGDSGGGALRIHTVGQDCSCGKMLSSVELTLGLQRAGHDAKFVPTGQTGILVAPGINASLQLTEEERNDPMAGGCPIDAVVADFINGAAEGLVKRNQHHEIIIIEGQASLVHPSYSSVTYGLLHGTLPHGLILCYEPGRPHLHGRPHLPLTPLPTVKALYEHVSNLEQRCEFIGVAMSGWRLEVDAAEDEKKRLADALQLPVCDVVRDGPGVLVEAVRALNDDIRMTNDE